MKRFDVVVIGAGWGGYTAAVQASRYGLTVGLIERDLLGGTCLHRGCIPTKVLLQSADMLELAQRLAEFGVTTSEPSLDFKTVYTRMGTVVARLYRGLQTLVASSGVELMAGVGTMAGTGRVQLRAGGGTETLEAGSVILATGSVPRVLPGLAVDGKRVLDSDNVLKRESVPASVTVLGAGAVGVEFASFYRDAGAEVTLIEMLPALLPLEDAEIAGIVRSSFEARGIRVLTAATARPTSLKHKHNGVELEVDLAGSTERLQAEAVLVAIGRTPVTSGLGLDEAGVRMDRGFIAVDDEQRTSLQGVFAVGDVTGGLLLAHVAAAEGARAAAVIAGRPSAPVSPARLPRATYCRPQVASVGISEAEALAAGLRVKVGRARFSANARAVVLGETAGLVKVVAGADDDVLGVHLVGAGVSELINTGALARFLDCSLWELATTVYPHPTLSEAIGEAARAAGRRPLRLPPQPGSRSGGTQDGGRAAAD